MISTRNCQRGVRKNDRGHSWPLRKLVDSNDLVLLKWAPVKSIRYQRVICADLKFLYPKLKVFVWFIPDFPSWGRSWVIPTRNATTACQARVCSSEEESCRCRSCSWEGCYDHSIPCHICSQIRIRWDHLMIVRCFVFYLVVGWAMKEFNPVIVGALWTVPFVHHATHHLGTILSMPTETEQDTTIFGGERRPWIQESFLVSWFLPPIVTRTSDLR